MSDKMSKEPIEKIKMAIARYRYDDEIIFEAGDAGEDVTVADVKALINDLELADDEIERLREMLATMSCMTYALDKADKSYCVHCKGQEDESEVVLHREGCIYIIATEYLVRCDEASEEAS